jgi:uncharacterized membrane protein YgcG
VAAGELFRNADRLAIDTTIRKCEQQSRIEFSVFVGEADGDPRPFATQLHNTLVAPSRSVLIMVDPVARAIEVVTGGYVRSKVTDAEVELAIAAMQTSFAAGDLAGGIRQGITMIAEHATGPKTLHA